jgi:anaerobic glycerol-3-phosphate dehydrogenase
VFRWFGTDSARTQLMISSHQYDAVVIRSGQAGILLSFALAQAGMRTALIETKSGNRRTAFGLRKFVSR